MRLDDKINASQSKIHIPLVECDLILADVNVIFFNKYFHGRYKNRTIIASIVCI